MAANEAGNELTPRALDFSPEAKAAWVAFHDGIEAAMAPDGALENLRDVGSKAAENAARIAGVLTIIENPEATIIDGETMASGCELAPGMLTRRCGFPTPTGNRRASAMRSGYSIGFRQGQA